ncbi:MULTISPECIES: ester cyclase [unclassified Haladaptatus]|uniref:ester cyclase n=1 Tax=unclassified Haladaptatus TaxID=2622732 RepID=UPI00209C657B|nr:MULTISPECIES: ester cyclase [unclassified Haladaptatus]MCO8244544.1 ester cyclase [Haladaptatus sp. AB643]MCO8253834.1 ester cyclase [Haladaptatus sp. AB618]
MAQTTANTEIVREFVEQAFNNGNLEVADEYLAEDFVRHDPDMGEVRGREKYKEFIEMNRTAFPDYHETIENIITQGDTVMYRWTLRGTQEGEFMGVAPTGNEIEVTGMIDMRLENGRITELWGNFDALGLLKELDAVPEGV